MLNLYITMQWMGFKIVGDNIDKNIKARHETMETTNQSLHFFHAFAVKDRVHLSQCSDVAPLEPDEIKVSELLPTASEVSTLLERFKLLIMRYGCKHGKDSTQIHIFI